MLICQCLLQLSNAEVWFQRPKDIVRKLLSGDLDLGIVGLDTVGEFGQVSIKVSGVFCVQDVSLIF
jgi:ATP phosphoribosyltransferase